MKLNLPSVDEPALTTDPTLASDAEPVVMPVPHLEGPFDSLWATEHGAEMAASSNITETECVVESRTSPIVGQWASLSLFFSVARRLLLTGRVVRLLNDGVCVFRFVNLSSDDRRSLRVEIRRGTTPPRTPHSFASNLYSGVAPALASPANVASIMPANRW